MPELLLSAFLTMPVAVLVNVTPALGTVAPDESWTVPVTIPSPVCAARGIVIETSARRNFLTYGKKLVITHTLSKKAWNGLRITESLKACQTKT
jgi:hypothetical protein